MKNRRKEIENKTVELHCSDCGSEYIQDGQEYCSECGGEMTEEPDEFFPLEEEDSNEKE